MSSKERWCNHLKSLFRFVLFFGHVFVCIFKSWSTPRFQVEVPSSKVPRFQVPQNDDIPATPSHHPSPVTGHILLGGKDHPFILKLVQTFKDQRWQQAGFGESTQKWPLTVFIFIYTYNIYIYVYRWVHIWCMQVSQKDKDYDNVDVIAVVFL